MIDQRKAAEATRQIQDHQRKISSHQANITRLEREKAEKAKYIDQQIRSEQDQVARYLKQIELLKRQI
jgi:hypothetical protein